VRKVVKPRTNILDVRTILAPYRSIIHPVIGEKKIEASAPALTAPAINVMFHPNSWCIGYMKIARVRLPAAFLTTWVAPDVPKITHP
tara:strand:+ start:153 stop:413 length:261 start_codon:yes stop_codon:yes gene_type:complete